MHQTAPPAKPAEPLWSAPSSRRLIEAVAEKSSRRGFLARTGRLLLAVSGSGVIAAALKAERAEAFHFCGHIYTTGSCPHPTGLPRIDRAGFPLRASDGHPVDDLGRLVDSKNRPVDAQGNLLLDPDGNPLPPAPRTRICEVAAKEHHFKPYHDGSWYRCCGGRIRRLMDCCGYVRNRINGDGALTGYCYRGRKVFCVMYYDSKIKC